MSQELKQQLTNIVQESAISDIIMSDRNDMDQVCLQRLYNEWKQEVRRLQQELEQAKANVYGLKKNIKKKCNHTNITEEISPGFERSLYEYRCNQCGFYVEKYVEFDYKNITNTKEY